MTKILPIALKMDMQENVTPGLAHAHIYGITEELFHAIKKHPKFPTECFGKQLEDGVDTWLKDLRATNSKKTKTTKYTVIEEEVLEAIQAEKNGNLFDAYEEWAQVAAVAIRCMHSCAWRLKQKQQPKQTTTKKAKKGTSK